MKDKVVVITGASRGIGAVLAIELGKLGAKLVCGARNPQGLARAVAEVRAQAAKAWPSRPMSPSKTRWSA